YFILNFILKKIKKNLTLYITDTEALSNDFRRLTYGAENWSSDRSSLALRESRGLSFDFSLCLCASVVR
ncbi:MAG: hypothetical protein ACMUIU_14160, partial [bacterium]